MMEKIRVALVGRTRSGKSTLINALLGDDVCHVTAAVDTTDKVHKLAAGEEGGQSGIYLFDTPGAGGEEKYESWTRAYLDLPNPDPVDIVPVCRVNRESGCLHAVLEPLVVPESFLQGDGGDAIHWDEDILTLPRAFEEHRSPRGRELTSCQQSKCKFFLPIPTGNPELVEERPDLILYLARAQSGGLVKEDKKFLDDLWNRYDSDRIVAVLTCIDEVGRKNTAEVLSKIADQKKIPFMAVSARTGEGMDRLRKDLFRRLANAAVQAYKRTCDTIEHTLLRDFHLRVDFVFDFENNELRLFPFGKKPHAELCRGKRSHRGELVVARSEYGISKLDAKFQWQSSKYGYSQTFKWKIEIRCSPALQPSRFAAVGYWCPSELRIHDGDRWHERKARRPE